MNKMDDETVYTHTTSSDFEILRNEFSAKYFGLQSATK